MSDTIKQLRQTFSKIIEFEKKEKMAPHLFTKEIWNQEKAGGWVSFDFSKINEREKSEKYKVTLLSIDYCYNIYIWFDSSTLMMFENSDQICVISSSSDKGPIVAFSKYLEKYSHLIKNDPQNVPRAVWLQSFVQKID